MNLEHIKLYRYKVFIDKQKSINYRVRASELNLSGCNIGEAVGKEIQRLLLHNATLVRIDIQDNIFLPPAIHTDIRAKLGTRRDTDKQQVGYIGLIFILICNLDL